MYRNLKLFVIMFTIIYCYVYIVIFKIHQEAGTYLHSITAHRPVGIDIRITASNIR